MFDHAINTFESNVVQFTLNEICDEIRLKIKEINLTRAFDPYKLINLLNFTFKKQEGLSKTSSLRKKLRQTINQIIDNYYVNAENFKPKDSHSIKNRLRIILQGFILHLEQSIFLFIPPENELQSTTVLSSPIKNPSKHDPAFYRDAVRSGINIISLQQGECSPVSHLDALGFNKNLAYFLKGVTSQTDISQHQQYYLIFDQMIREEFGWVTIQLHHNCFIEPLNTNQACITFSGKINQFSTLLPSGFMDEKVSTRQDDQPWIQFSQEMHLSSQDDTTQVSFSRGHFHVIACCHEMYLNIKDVPSLINIHSANPDIIYSPPESIILNATEDSKFTRTNSSDNNQSVTPRTLFFGEQNDEPTPMKTDITLHPKPQF